MILAVYVIGSAVALVVLSIRLRDARDQLGRMRRERNAYARTIETSLLARREADQTAASSALPDPVRVRGERW
jgi:hypothetical protein